MVLVQNARKNSFLVDVNLVMQFERTARLRGASPGIQVHPNQCVRLSVALGGDVLDATNKITELVKCVPGGKLNFRRGRGLRYRHGDGD